MLFQSKSTLILILTTTLILLPRTANSDFIMETTDTLDVQIDDMTACSTNFNSDIIVMLDLKKFLLSLGYPDIETVNKELFMLLITKSGLSFPSPYKTINMNTGQEITTVNDTVQNNPTIEANGENIMRYKLVNTGGASYSTTGDSQITIFIRMRSGKFYATYKKLTPKLPLQQPGFVVTQTGRYLQKNSCFDFTLNFDCKFQDDLFQVYFWRSLYWENDDKRRFQWLKFSTPNGVSVELEKETALGEYGSFSYTPTLNGEGLTNLRVWGDNISANLNPQYTRNQYRNYDELKIQSIMGRDFSKAKSSYSYRVCGVVGGFRQLDTFVGFKTAELSTDQIQRFTLGKTPVLPTHLRFTQASISNQTLDQPWEIHITEATLDVVEVLTDEQFKIGLDLGPSGKLITINIEIEAFRPKNEGDSTAESFKITVTKDTDAHGVLLIDLPVNTMLWGRFNFKLSGTRFPVAGEMNWNLYFLDGSFVMSEKIPLIFDVSKFATQTPSQNGINVESKFDQIDLERSNNQFSMLLLLSPAQNAALLEDLDIVIEGGGYLSFARNKPHFESQVAEEWKQAIELKGAQYAGQGSVFGVNGRGVELKKVKLTRSDTSAIRNTRKEYFEIIFKNIDFQIKSDRKFKISVFRTLDKSKISEFELSGPEISTPEFLNFSKQSVDYKADTGSLFFQLETNPAQKYFYSYLDLVLAFDDPIFSSQSEFQCELRTIPDRSGATSIAHLDVTNSKNEIIGSRLVISHFLDSPDLTSSSRFSNTVSDQNYPPEALTFTCSINTTLVKQENHFFGYITDRVNSNNEGSIDSPTHSTSLMAWVVKDCPLYCNLCQTSTTPHTCNDCRSGYVPHEAKCITQSKYDELTKEKDLEYKLGLLGGLLDGLVKPKQEQTPILKTAQVLELFSISKLEKDLKVILPLLSQNEQVLESASVEKLKKMRTELATFEAQRVLHDKEMDRNLESAAGTEILIQRSLVMGSITQLATITGLKLTYGSKMNMFTLAPTLTSTLLSAVTFLSGYKAIREIIPEYFYYEAREEIQKIEGKFQPLMESIYQTQSERPSVSLLESMRKSQTPDQKTEIISRVEKNLANNLAREIDSSKNLKITNTNNPSPNIQNPEHQNANIRTKYMQSAWAEQIALIKRTFEFQSEIDQLDPSCLEKDHGNCSPSYLHGQNLKIKCLQIWENPDHPGITRVRITNQLSKLTDSESSIKNAQPSTNLLKISIFSGMASFYLLFNLSITIWFFYKMRQKSLRFLRLWSLSFYGPVMFGLSVVFTPTVYMWVFAFNFFRMYFKLKSPLSEINSFKRCFKVAMFASFACSLLVLVAALCYAALAGLWAQGLSVYFLILLSALSACANLIIAIQIKTKLPSISRKLYVKSKDRNHGSLAFYPYLEENSSRESLISKSLKSSKRGRFSGFFNRDQKKKKTQKTQNSKGEVRKYSQVAGNFARAKNLFEGEKPLFRQQTIQDPLERRMKMKLPNTERLLERMAIRSSGRVSSFNQSRSAMTVHLGKFLQKIKDSDPSD